MTTLIALILCFVAPPAAHATADPKPVPVAGVVVEPSGQPVSGADVWLVNARTADEDRHFGLELIWSSRTRASEGTIPVVVHGRTDSAGRFTLELAPEITAARAASAGGLGRDRRASPTHDIAAAAANRPGRRSTAPA